MPPSGNDVMRSAVWISHLVELCIRCFLQLRVFAIRAGVGVSECAVDELHVGVDFTCFR